MSERFIIEQQISARDSADAYLAYDTKTDRKVSLRRIHSQMTPEQLEAVSEAFLVTQRQLALVKSDTITHIADSGIDDQGAWLSIPYNETQPLLSIQALPMPLPEFHNLATQLLQGLRAIHEQNLVHGALNTDSLNVLPAETPDRRTRYFIRDLGMRRLLILVQNPSALASLPSDPSTLAPELFSSQDAEPSSDLYMAGHLFYYFIVGGHPFAGLDPETALQKHLSHEISLAHTINPHIPAEVSGWLDKMTQPELRNRFQSAEEALAALPFIAPDIKRQPTELVYSRTGKLTTAHAIHSKPPTAVRKFPPYIYVLAALLLIATISFYVIMQSDKDPDTHAVKSPPAKELVTVEIKASGAGIIRGGAISLSNTKFQLGSNLRATKRWGEGDSNKATGPDIGASYRAFVLFKISDIIDASDSDSIVNVGSLNNLSIELSVNKQNSVSFQPLLYTPRIIQKLRNATIKELSQKLEKGVPPTENGNTYTFTMEKINLSNALYDQEFFFILTASKKPDNGEILELDKSSISLKITQ